jgi:hypothetical protein
MARRYLELSDEITDLDELINPLVEALAPQLLARVGIGVEVAGQMLVTAGGNPDRMTSEAAFAMSPVRAADPPQLSTCCKWLCVVIALAYAPRDMRLA